MFTSQLRRKIWAVFETKISHPEKMSWNHRENTKRNFLSITGAHQNSKLDEFLGKYDWNLERCINSYFDLGWKMLPEYRGIKIRL